MEIIGGNLRDEEHHHNYPMMSRNRVNNKPAEYEMKLEYDGKQVLAVQKISQGVPITQVPGYIMDYQPRRLKLPDGTNVSVTKGIPFGFRSRLERILKKKGFKGKVQFLE